MAGAAYTIVPPLPAPETAGEIGVNAESLAFYWYTAEPPPDGDDLVAFLVRWREVGSAAWTYEPRGPGIAGYRYGVQAFIEGLRDAVTYEAAVAPMRHPLDAETPAALRWTPNEQATTPTYPANVTVTTTHDTVTVRWDRQPSVTSWGVSLSNYPDHYTDARISAHDAAAWGDPASGTHEVTFRHLVPDTEYSLSIGSGSAPPRAPQRDFEVTVRTKPAPADETPLPRGPQNLRATSTATTITVTWDPPFAGAKQSYEVLLLDQNATQVLGREWVYAPPWTVTFGVPSATEFPLPSGVPFRINVFHNGRVRAEEEISIATQPTQASGSARGSASPVPVCIEYLVGAVICA